jgi:hypothetical protein
VVVARFVLTAQPDLWMDNAPTTLQDWLVLGGDADRVLNLIDTAEWLRA